MTDNEIIKALECCSNYPEEQSCSECPLNSRGADCLDFELGKFVLDLINRQKAEIESLKDKLNHSGGVIERQSAELDELTTKLEKLQCSYDCELAYRKELHKQAKAEAVKELAERLKDIYAVHDGLHMTIDNLVKEMVGAESGS